MELFFFLGQFIVIKLIEKILVINNIFLSYFTAFGNLNVIGLWVITWTGKMVMN